MQVLKRKQEVLMNYGVASLSSEIRMGWPSQLEDTLVLFL